MAGASGPSWMGNYQQQSAASAEQTGVTGVAVPMVSFDEGINHFRLMPPAEAVSAVIEGLKTNKPYDLSAGGFPPCARFQLYMPAYTEGGGLSLFGNEVVASPLTHLFGDNRPHIEDPVQKWLDSSGIKWMKKADLDRDKRAAAIRASLACKDRVIIQLVNFGVVGAGLQRPAFNPAELKVECWAIWNDDFDGVYCHPMFVDPEQRRRPSVDPGWWGINMSITRVGQKRDTKYNNCHGIYGPPYAAHDSQYGYPMLLDQSGHPDMLNIERLLKQVMPFRQLIRTATPEELTEAMHRTLKAIDEKFAPAQVPVGNMPGQPPAPPQNFGAPPANPGYGAPPAYGAPPTPYGNPAQPPAPAAPPANSGYGAPPPIPQYGQQPQPSAPPPPNYGAPQQYQQPQNMATVPATPPQMPNLSSPPAANTLDPRQMQQATQQYGAPPTPPASHAGPPAYGAPPTPPAPPAYGAPPAPPAPPVSGAR